MFDVSKLIRPKIYSLEPYRCARDDFKTGILLDANENSFGSMVAEHTNSGLNRYPDPHQVTFKTRMANFRNSEASGSDVPIPIPTEKDLVVTYENLCLGVGSDESIDALIRSTCVPAKDKIIICPPTYGMYKILCQVNDIEYVSVPLDDSFDIDDEAIIAAIKENPTSKLVLITSPGNPTAKLANLDKVKKLLLWGLKNWNGLFVLDEAYVDFAPLGSSLSVLVEKHPNLVVLQTLSKSFGLAGIRLGITFACKEISQVLNSLKAPYNISSLTSDIAEKAVSPESIALMRAKCQEICDQRQIVVEKLTSMKQFGKLLGGLDANFILIEVLKNGKPDSAAAKQVYEKMAIEKKVVVRFRGSEPNCEGALRITIGTPEENTEMFSKFAETFAELGL